MKDLLQPTGNTPFELAEARLAAGQAQVRAATALQELCTLSEECDAMITAWRKELRAGTVTEETRSIAVQALKEKRACNTNIERLVALMAHQFNIEA